MQNKPPLYYDLDKDCEDLDHLHYFLYDPGKGRCPYLSTTKLIKEKESFHVKEKAH